MATGVGIACKCGRMGMGNSTNSDTRARYKAATTLVSATNTCTHQVRYPFHGNPTQVTNQVTWFSAHINMALRKRHEGHCQLIFHKL